MGNALWMVEEMTEHICEKCGKQLQDVSQACMMPVGSLFAHSNKDERKACMSKQSNGDSYQINGIASFPRTGTKG
jgi:hypothetical protein